MELRGAVSVQRPRWRVMTVITVATVITEIPRFHRNEQGRNERVMLPQRNSPDVPHSNESKSRWAKSFGMKWNQPAFWKVCKLLKRWWPATESNRRRQPLQGCYPR